MLQKKSNLRRKKSNVSLRVLYRLRSMVLWLVIGTFLIPIISTGYINLVTIGDR